MSDDFLDNPYFRVQLAELDPKEQAKVVKEIQKIAKGKDQAPSGRGATQATPLAQLDIVTSRFDVTRIPLSRLGQMRRDPVIAFAMFFILAQLTRARWMIKSQDPQAAAFADNALRAIYSDLVATYVEKLAYGYQAAVKRFALSSPDWTYVDPTDASGGEKPVWSNGSVQAVVWKPLAPIHPMAADPIWDEKLGSFAGIKYTPGTITTLSGGVGSADTEPQEYDVLQSLWFTNELASVHNSLWGFPRTGYAYRFWWSFWFDWGLADRHFEKDADPPVVVRFPPNQVIDGVASSQLALNIGDRVRSNSTIALPNDLIEGFDGKATSTPAWNVDFLKGGGNFDVFKERFDQVQSFIFRAMMIPPDTFDAKGGTAGYNANSNLLDAFQLSQINLMADLDFAINEYMLPQLMAANGFEAKVTKVTKGFDSTDIELAKMLIQGKANSNDPELGSRIDWEELLDATGIPRLSAASIAAKAQQVQQTAPATPAPVAATPGSAGVTEKGLYYAPREVISLSSDRPLTFAQFSDPVIADNTDRLRNVWHESIRADYSDAAMLIQQYKGEGLLLDETFFERWWRRSVSRAQETAAQTRRTLSVIMRRASAVELEDAGVKDFSWDPSYDERAINFIAERGGELVTGISETTRNELKRYISDLQSRDVPADHMSDLVQSHFSMFAGSRAGRVVRTEVSRAYNMATLLTAKDAGITHVKALDAQLGESRSDPTCIARNGTVFTLSEAFIETEKEHPYGTLQWKLIR